MTENFAEDPPPELRARDFDRSDDPFALFREWLSEAEAGEPNDPNAMALATVDPAGMPNVRMVLLKGLDARGFAFFTNAESAKGVELAASPRAALLFHWKSLRRQVRVRGPVERVGDDEADAYFATRPRGSRIGAWASRQSRPLESRAALLAAVSETESRFPGPEVPRPPFWSGYRVLPLAMEFWHDRPFRLHDRILFARDDLAAPWRKTRLFP